MPDDVESALEGLERRLRALQLELDAEAAAEEPPLAPVAAPAREPAPARERRAPAPAPAGLDPLEHFGEELHRATAALLAAWERAVAGVRGDGGEGTLFSGTVAVEAEADLRALCALENALTRVPAVAAVGLRAYAGGHAALDVALDRPVALARELRSAVALDVLEAGGGRLRVALR
jgi:hypothetical protein